MSDAPDLNDLAERAQEFVKSPFGENTLTILSLAYNQLHQEAESEGLTVEQKAFKIERAAGLKIAIDFFNDNANLFTSGYLKNLV